MNRHISKGKDRNPPHDHLHRHRESISYNSTFIHHKHSSQSGYGGNISQHNKSYTGPTHSKHTSQQWHADSLPAKMWKKKGTTCTPSIQHGTGSPTYNNQTRTRNERHPDWKQQVWLSWYADNMILYWQSPKDATHQLQVLANKFRKVAGCKIAIQNSVAFLHSNNRISERENNAKKAKQTHLKSYWKTK